MCSCVAKHINWAGGSSVQLKGYCRVPGLYYVGSFISPPHGKGMMENSVGFHHFTTLFCLQLRFERHMWRRGQTDVEGKLTNRQAVHVKTQNKDSS